MASKALFSAWFLGILIKIGICEDTNIFAISPVEFHPSSDVTANVKSYQEIIGKASTDSVDIVVFPEFTLFEKSNIASLVPDPKDNVTPYNNDSYKDYEPIQKISRAADNGNIYVVINLREVVKSNKIMENSSAKDNDIFYNTNVVFDRNGKVIARYRKYNLFDEFNIEKPNEPELVTFETDFGVKFGIFTCFDILFQKPAMDLIKKMNIKNFIFPTYWFSELPFLTAAQIQAGWSYSMNVNLIAAGGNNPKTSATGTGCYHKREKFMQVMLEETMTGNLKCFFPKNENKSATLQFADKIKMSPNNKEISSKLNFKYSDPTITLATQKILNETAGVFSENICSNDFCCNFNVKFRKSEYVDKLNHSYKAVVYKGKRNFGITTFGYVEYCAIVLCQDNHCGLKPPPSPYFLEFEKIEIHAIFDSEDTLHFPNTLIYINSSSLYSNLHSMNYESFQYNSKLSGSTENVSMELTNPNVNNLITFGIYGRNFNGAKVLQFYSHLLIISVFFIYFMK